MTAKERGELNRLERDLANGRIAPNAHGNAVVRINELRAKGATR